MKNYPTAIGLGEILRDEYLLKDGSSTSRMGGAPANFVYFIERQGVSASIVSAVGEDRRGSMLGAECYATGIPAVLQRVPYRTGEVHIELDGAGIPRYTILPDAAWDHIPLCELLLDYARHARVVCFGSLAQRSEESRATIAAFLKAMPQGEESWRIFDVNLREGYYTHAILRDSLSMANVLKANEEEMEILGRLEGFRGLPQLEQARLLMERYSLRYVLLTCGALGSYVLGDGGQVLSWLPAQQVHVMDTVGAGDSFTAAFIAGLLRGLAVPEAHAEAVELSAYVCTRMGAIPQLTEVPDVEKLDGEMTIHFVDDESQTDADS